MKNLIKILENILLYLLIILCIAAIATLGILIIYQIYSLAEENWNIENTKILLQKNKNFKQYFIQIKTKL